MANPVFDDAYFGLLSEKKYPSENIFATGLLGSHFGIPGLPGAYDYVIIGGGTAGLTIARRLAANTSVTVAVIEAGSFYELTNGNFSEIPADAVYWLDPGATARNQLYDWYQFTTPQKVSFFFSIHAELSQYILCCMFASRVDRHLLLSCPT